MRYLLGALVAAALMAVLGLQLVILMSSWEPVKVRQETTVVFTPPLEQKLRALQDLVTLEVRLSDVLSARSQTRLKVSPLPPVTVQSVEGVWIIAGDVTLTVDLGRAEVRLDSQRKSAVVRLPQPAVSRPRVDHESTRTYEVERGLLTPSAQEGAMRDHAMVQAQRMLERAAGNEKYLAQARANAERAVAALFRHDGWTVRVEWEGREAGESVAERR